MIIFTRLVDKDLVERIGDGRRYLYRAADDLHQLTARAIKAQLGTSAPAGLTAAFLLDRAMYTRKGDHMSPAP